jgi:hypothetical protein
VGSAGFDDHLPEGIAEEAQVRSRVDRQRVLGHVFRAKGSTVYRVHSRPRAGGALEGSDYLTPEAAIAALRSYHGEFDI